MFCLCNVDRELRAGDSEGRTTGIKTTEEEEEQVVDSQRGMLLSKLNSLAHISAVDMPVKIQLQG